MKQHLNLATSVDRSAVAETAKRGLGLAAIAIAASLTLGCGTNPVSTGNGAAISCGVGETVALDKQGNKYCQNALDGGTIGQTDSGKTGTPDVTGTDAVGTDSGSGSADAGAAYDGNSSGVDAGPIDPWWSCPPVKRSSGAAHGKACKVHADCLYGNCVKGGHLTGYNDAISYCTKNNACTGGGSLQTAPCSSDNGAPPGVTYGSVFEKSKSGGNDKRTAKAPVKVCGRVCKTDSECQSWNPEMPDCITGSTKYVSLGTQGVCGKNPLK